MKFTAIALLSLVAARAAAQAPSPDPAKPPSIQDNSFLVEEAYNQEAGVVQHITALNIDQRSRAYELGFTQEWPVGSIRHQLSYLVPMVRTDLQQRNTGIGDVMLNYRYQLTGDGDAPLAVSPRLSAILPTGAWRTGRGNGATGVEAFLPASVVVSDLLVTHWNAGVRYTPSARNQAGERAGVARYALGGSAIARVLPYLHLMLETVWSREDEVVGPEQVVAGNSWTVLPGFRAALNHRSGLQIVPGIGFPFGAGPSRGDRGVFLYVSFEHPFNREGRAGK